MGLFSCVNFFTFIAKFMPIIPDPLIRQVNGGFYWDNRTEAINFKRVSGPLAFH